MGTVSKNIQVTVVGFSTNGGSYNATQIVAKHFSGGKITEGWTMPWPVWSSLDVRAVPKKSYYVLAPEFGKLTGYPVQAMSAH